MPYKIISFDDMKKPYALDKQNHKSRSLTKITDAHIYQNSFKNVRVKLAAQLLLSNSVSVTIRTRIQTGPLKNNTFAQTIANGVLHCFEEYKSNDIVFLMANRLNFRKSF